MREREEVQKVLHGEATERGLTLPEHQKRFRSPVDLPVWSEPEGVETFKGLSPRFVDISPSLLKGA